MTGASPVGDQAAGLRPQPAAPSSLSSIPSAGDVFEVPFPFVRETYSGFDGDGYSEVPTWRPGVRFEGYSPEDCGAVADAIGSATFTVVAAFKPGRFPTRVFFTRKFRSPDGDEFGKGKLHIATLDKFRRLARGYQHQFGLGEPLEARFGHRAARQTFEQMLAEYASAMSARSGETEGLAPKAASAVPQADAQNTPAPPSQGTDQ